ncbi:MULTISPECIES: sigma-70 family RNA polymerase sigma factor [unclassified Mesorhizobium]|uniref:sigma-70 family RNA polymerase sigma factor n=1 Tax=unclassified Mesorhizobium TaxID=325217 RepID=UPI0011268827|nr:MULTISPECIES: sigma-70 family RNA polymerase sigma factor [unclassified Mesorhizobium]TPK57615.1 sigma-70 family RNA polymerase sigma factor [Mesorhizobium sp. B2-5-1]TPM54627.1 sigma-70 family RNA polymerase sigma factor [Mesorhizobium sp. B2-1-9]TPM81123.1 sigma-70 family RNA polymerase sigma factor [Mesorhizobium sp. B2-1-4]TPN05459.1 sigma-70 family RNA polymerase sigma factor [Mesorhizobium sp. B2-1-2]TPN62344.1 sigma-70 family RNA polymerase sigma factor [Mesorhizobium sp. B1-1-1]
MSGKDEAELSRLMRAAIAGDERAYADFLHRTAALVRGFARRKIVKGGVDPEDVVQETLLAIHVKRHTWRQDAPVLPWVYAIARFKLIDAFRRRGRRIEIDVDGIAETFAEPETETVSERDINRALDGLPPAQRSVVSSVSVEGRSIGDTAAKFGISETAVRVSLHRGLAAIAKRFRQGRFGQE